ncbi:MAG: hypothetical protein QOI24_1979 [Acidobacteriota bacterium]|jgi:hypothetical protein|nr:hypothetical protein [Acidobacteriota bacterium]
MVFVPIVVFAIAAFAVPFLMHRHAIRLLREFARRAGWEDGEYDWLMSTMESRWNRVPVSFWRVRNRSRLRLERPSAVTLHMTRKSDALAWLNDAFRADVIEIEPSVFRFHGDAVELARALNSNDEIAFAMHEVPYGGAELIIDREGITVTARSYWNETPDAAWRLILAVDRLLTPERRAL